MLLYNFLKRAPMVKLACKTPILYHPIPIKHLINSRKLQNIKVRRNAADQNEKNEKDQKRPTPKTKPPASESIHRPASRTDPHARQQEKSQEIAPALENSDDGALGGYGVYGSGSSIGVGCDGEQLALPDRMAEKMMAAVCRGAEVLGGKVRPTEAMANRWRCS
jgi:hypothetical protein